MEANEWVARCSARLHAQWPRLPQRDRDEMAAELWKNELWRSKPPEEAAREWLRQGIPEAA